MSALDLISTASDETFAGRVMILMFKAGQMVASEAPDAPNHAERVAYAQRVMRGQEQPQLVAAHVISSNPTIAQTIESDPAALGSNVPDADIEFALSSIWTARSLAFAAVA
ncbi:hypothetical protein ACVI1J_004136 [Bradyrhizobium diazoefficiens]|jgi:hypothetical protein|nr:hypothetical protein [Bradyrhizobium liaoningense]MBR0940964.1 hypothetical protein [Bradyrhizobium liaoningense]